MRSLECLGIVARWSAFVNPYFRAVGTQATIIVPVFSITIQKSLISDMHQNPGKNVIFNSPILDNPLNIENACAIITISENNAIYKHPEVTL